MRSSEKKNSNQSSSANPYAPPHEVLREESREHRLKFPLGKVYWLLMSATLVVDAVLVTVPLLYQSAKGQSRPFFPNLFLTPAIGLGLFGAIVSGFALTYSLAYMRRVARSNYLRRLNEIREQQFDFYARGMSIGLLLTISTLTAFVCSCVPISLPFISYSAGGGLAGDTSLATGLAVTIALMVGGFIIYKLLPREDLR